MHLVQLTLFLEQIELAYSRVFNIINSNAKLLLVYLNVSFSRQIFSYNWPVYQIEKTQDFQKLKSSSTLLSSKQI